MRNYSKTRYGSFGLVASLMYIGQATGHTDSRGLPSVFEAAGVKHDKKGIEFTIPRSESRGLRIESENGQAEELRFRRNIEAQGRVIIIFPDGSRLSTKQARVTVTRDPYTREITIRIERLAAASSSLAMP